MSFTKCAFAATLSAVSLCNPNTGGDSPNSDPECAGLSQVTNPNTLADVSDALYDSLEGQGMSYIEVGAVYSDGDHYFFVGGSCYLDDYCESGTSGWWSADYYYYTEALLDAAPLRVVDLERSPSSEWSASWEATEYERIANAQECF